MSTPPPPRSSVPESPNSTAASQPPPEAPYTNQSDPSAAAAEEAAETWERERWKTLISPVCLKGSQRPQVCLEVHLSDQGARGHLRRLRLMKRMEPEGHGGIALRRQEEYSAEVSVHCDESKVTQIIWWRICWGTLSMRSKFQICCIGIRLKKSMVYGSTTRMIVKLLPICLVGTSYDDALKISSTLAVGEVDLLIIGPLQGCGADIHVIVKIESADSIPNLHSIITASDGAMVARGDLGAELPIEEVPLLQEEIINMCRSMGKAVIVATNMLESMIVHPTPTRAEVSDIAIAVREGADAVMLSGETAHGKYPLKAVKVMHTVALRTEATIVGGEKPANLGHAFKNHMSEMFAYHATMMSNTLGTSLVVFTRTGFMAILLSHYRPSGTIYAFTNEERVRQRLSLYQGVCPIYMEFKEDAEETFTGALSYLQKQGMVKEGEEVALVQSGRQPIWRFQSTHNIQVRKV